MDRARVDIGTLENSNVRIGYLMINGKWKIQEINFTQSLAD